MTDETTRQTLRIPDPLLERLRRAAERDHRSVHGQILAYLEKCLAEDEKKVSRR
jgi:hypothetical protein